MQQWSVSFFFYVIHQKFEDQYKKLQEQYRQAVETAKKIYAEKLVAEEMQCLSIHKEKSAIEEEFDDTKVVFEVFF